MSPKSDKVGQWAGDSAKSCSSTPKAEVGWQNCFLLGGRSVFGLLRPLPDWMRPTHIMVSNLLLRGHWFTCSSHPKNTFTETSVQYFTKYLGTMVQPKEHIKLAITTCYLHFLYSLIIHLFSYHLINIPKAMDTAKHFTSFASFLSCFLSICCFLVFLMPGLPLHASLMILSVVLPRLPGSYHILVVLTTKFISSI